MIILVAPAPIPRLDLRVFVYHRVIAWYATGATECWITDLAGNLLTPDLPPRGLLTLPPGIYRIHAHGVMQETIQVFEIKE